MDTHKILDKPHVDTTNKREAGIVELISRRKKRGGMVREGRKERVTTKKETNLINRTLEELSIQKIQ
jgi:hypothetical protein